MDPALRALNRFGLGARVGERAGIGDSRAWLEDQLRPGAADLVGGTPVQDAEIAEAVANAQEARRSGDPDAVRQSRRGLSRILDVESRAVLETRLQTAAPFVERLVSFWSNHLCVSVAGKQPLIPLAGQYEREAVRPHVLGRFEDMVLASARHPAMLLYLDNARSIGPNSTGASGRRGDGPERGLNENYARELLELHTLGVDGGYAQADVEALARILTGWTISGPGGAPENMAAGGRSRVAPPVETVDTARSFVFRPRLHEPGSKTVLGLSYGPGGVDEGEAVIRDLCAHPGTARFVATKLVRHFVSDGPPPGAVDRIASVFLDTGGDLSEVSRSLVHLDDAWDPSSKKLRTPQDWLIAALRAVGMSTVPPVVAQAMRQLRHPLWAPGSPQGYSDEAGPWSDPDSLMNRAEFGRTLGERFSRNRSSANRLLEVIDEEDAAPLAEMFEDGSIQQAERVALVVGGPAFQWR